MSESLTFLRPRSHPNMRTLLTNLLEKTAVMRVLSGNLQRLSGNNAGKTGNMETMSRDIAKKSLDTGAKSEDFAKMSLDNAAESGDFAKMSLDNAAESGDFVIMSNDMENLSSDIPALSGDHTAMTGDSGRKSGVIASLVLNPVRKFVGWLYRPFGRTRAEHRARVVLLEQSYGLEFCRVYEKNIDPSCYSGGGYKRLMRDIEEMAMYRYLAIPPERGPRPYDKEMVLAFLIAFAVSLLRRFSTVARSVYNWQMPLHRSAAYSPRGSRPPPFTSVPWSAC